MVKEIWKDIPGYEGYYQVSNTGMVRGLERKVPHPTCGGKMTVHGKILTNQVLHNGSGYHQVVLSRNGKSKRLSVHRLVAATFVPNPENKPCINHKDGNGMNNKADNLEWCTYSENTIHAYKEGLFPKDMNSGSKNGRSKLTEAQVKEIRTRFHKADKKNTLIKDTYNKLMKDYGVSWKTIHRIIKGTHWKGIMGSKKTSVDYRTSGYASSKRRKKYRLHDLGRLWKKRRFG